MSLTRTLTLLATSVVLLIALVAAVWSYFESNHELEELFDAELAQSSRIVQGLVRHLAASESPQQLPAILEETLKLPEAALLEGDFNEIIPDGSGHKYEKKIAFEVWDNHGVAVLDTLLIPGEQPLEAGYSWVESTGYSWRTFTLQDPASGFWIRTAQREDIRTELSEELARGNVLPLLLALPLLAAALIFAIQVAFRPLRRLERPIRDMAPEKIHPLDASHAPKEVTGLVHAVNGLLKRLNSALERERRFSADAAHELRTPLTVLRLNLEKACEAHPHEFEGLIQSVDRMTYLVEQMLVLSRVDSATDFSPSVHNLSEIVEQSMAEVAPLALRKHIEPVLQDTTRQAMACCHGALINTLMRSLLANAIQYSPPETEVTTELTASGDGYLIRLCDQGPGIAAEERERALSRFVRLDQRAGGGAGLGLAIARRIAELHGGTLSLHDRPDGGPGLCVEIWLPAQCPTPGIA